MDATEIGSGGRLYRDAREQDERQAQALAQAAVDEQHRQQLADLLPTVPVADSTDSPVPQPLFKREDVVRLVPPAPPEPEQEKKAKRQWRKPRVKKEKLKKEPSVQTSKRRRTAGQRMSTPLELLGILLLSIAGWLVTPALGLLVLGVSFVLLGIALDWPARPSNDRSTGQNTSG